MTPYCPTCLEPFQSLTLFDAHRVGPYEPSGLRRCLTPDEMREKGWRHDGRTWRAAPPPERQSWRMRQRGADQKPPAPTRSAPGPETAA